MAVGAQFSSFTIIKQIKRIIADNKDIKVWNISLGSNQEVNDNFISAEAAVLDQIQFENDVVIHAVKRELLTNLGGTLLLIKKI